MEKYGLTLLQEVLVQRKMMGVLWCCCRWTLSWQLSLKFGLKFSNTTSRSLLLAIQHLTITHIASCDTYQMILYSQSIICDLHCVTGRFSYTLYSKLSNNNNVFSFRWWADTVPFGVDTWLKSKDRTPYRKLLYKILQLCSSWCAICRIAVYRRWHDIYTVTEQQILVLRFGKSSIHSFLLCGCKCCLPLSSGSIVPLVFFIFVSLFLWNK